MTMRYTVLVDGTAVHTIDYTDGLPHDERAQRTSAAVMKVVRGWSEGVGSLACGWTRRGRV